MPEATVKGTILILEDEAGIAQLERKRLLRAGYGVEVAISAAEARGLLARGGVDLMVLDYLLASEVNGLEFYRALRAEGTVVPSILVTGFSDESMLTQAIRAGIRDFLPKNADFLDYLVPTVERVFQQVQVENQLVEERAKLFREQAARAEAEAGRKALAEEDRRKDEFLAMLAHELRNPLSAISSAVQLAQASRSEENIAWSNDVITRQVKHLSLLIDDLLDVSRIRLGKIELRKQPLDAAETIARAVESVRPLIEKKRHELTVTRRTRPAPPGGRPDPPGADLRQPADQRRQVHRRGRGDPALGRPRGRRDRRPRERHGRGDRARDAAEDLRPLHPDRGHARPRPGRAGDRPHAGAEAGLHARRAGERHERRARGGAANSRCDYPPWKIWRKPRLGWPDRPPRPRPTTLPGGSWWWMTTWIPPRDGPVPENWRPSGRDRP